MNQRPTHISGATEVPLWFRLSSTKEKMKLLWTTWNIFPFRRISFLSLYFNRSHLTEYNQMNSNLLIPITIQSFMFCHFWSRKNILERTNYIIISPREQVNNSLSLKMYLKFVNVFRDSRFHYMWTTQSERLELFKRQSSQCLSVSNE